MCKCIFSKKLVFLNYLWNIFVVLKTILNKIWSNFPEIEYTWHVQKRYCAWKPYLACSKMLLRMETLLGMFKNVIAHGNPTRHVQKCYCAWKPYSACSKTLLRMETLLGMFKIVIAHGNPTRHVQKRYCAWKPYSACSKMLLRMETLLCMFKNVIAHGNPTLCMFKNVIAHGNWKPYLAYSKTSVAPKLCILRNVKCSKKK